jgi:hypothetical protein
MSEQAHYLCAGVVEDINDPELLGRVKVRVPHVYGPVGSADSISTKDLPWALPAGLPAGGSGASGGISWLPEVGDQVYVQFLDGEPEKPVWFWGNQAKPQRDKFKLHHYEGGKPVRAGLTRYGHTLEFNEASILVTSKSGYAAIFDEGENQYEGSLRLQTPKGQSLELSDLSESLEIIAPEIQVNVERAVTVLAETIDLETFSGDLKLASGNSVKVNYENQLTFGAGVEPFVLGNQLVAFLENLRAWLLAHTHSNGNQGSPTGPPIVPWTPSPQTSQLTSDSIFGE